MQAVPEKIAAILENSQTIAVVGLSSKPNRASYDVAQYMQQHGYRIVPINPTYAGTHILGELCYTSLSEAAEAIAKVNQQIDLVDCFRKSEEIMPIAKEAVAIGARCLWMQLGISNIEAAGIAEAAGLQVVMDRCIKVDHMVWQLV